LQNLWNQYMNIKTSLRPGWNRTNKAIAKEEKFTENLRQLFDISKPDAKQNLSEEDFLFLKDQRGPRKFTFGGKDSRKTSFSIKKCRRSFRFKKIKI